MVIKEKQNRQAAVELCGTFERELTESEFVTSAVHIRYGGMVLSRFLVTLLLALLVPFFSWADARSEDLLGKLASKIASMGDYRVEFRAEVKGQGSVEGLYTVSGDKYFIQVDGQEVRCDGKTRYEINHENREVLIDQVNPEDRNLLSNPTKAFEFANDQFRATYAGERTTADGRKCDAIMLHPVASDASFSDVLLLIDRATGLPALLRYRMEGSSDEVAITVKSFVHASGVQSSQFTLDRAALKEYELIDFR